MKINTALILCAGFGKRLNPITLNTPKPLLEIKDVSMLERCINLIKKLGIQKILINTFYLKNQFSVLLNSKNFNIDIKIIDDGDYILDTGGGIQNMIKHSNEKDFIIFNPDTIWNNDYKDEILKMEKMYFSEKLENILLLVNKKFSFDKKLKGDFNLKNNLINKEAEKEFIYIGCQIINKKLFIKEKIENYSILEIWNNLLDQKKLFGYESQKDFYHLTDLDIFKKLKDL
ncbi:sugar phosphate nucleotidyltransferase [Candidatus Pelagibacter sp.]|uniref:sugar phosphate nucleotidyltransferase n=1 Tax=Candidatus Pelagibacter sp. TaxID=2024849 RepID=UPI003F87593F